MPPASSPGSLDHPTARRYAAERASRVRFRRAVTLMVMTLVVPGSAQLVAGNRRVGQAALRVWGGVLAAGLLVIAISYGYRDFAYWLIASTGALALLQVTLMLLAVGWAALFLDAWRISQPLTLQQRHRLAVVGVNGLLCFSVAGTLLFGAHLVSVQRDFLNSIFGSGAASEAHDGRYNVLLLGGDSGEGRWGMRPDSITLASIDAETGKTVLFGLPRNLANFPFKEGSVMAEQFPDGFDCDDCYLNGVTTWALDHADLFEGTRTPGIDATVSAVEGITGLDVNYWAMVNMGGFRSLVDAVGGVTLNVRDRIPVGLPHESYFRYIEPGVQRLNGQDTLWFARARHGSDDYSRMARQKCVMGAMADQISPQRALRNFQKIAEASAAMIATDVPSGEVDTFLDLAMKARGQKMATVSFVPPLIRTSDPDIDLIHRRVDRAIGRVEGKKPKVGWNRVEEEPVETVPDDAAGPPPAVAPKTTTGGSLGSLRDGYVANDTEDLDASC